MALPGQTGLHPVHDSLLHAIDLIHTGTLYGNSDDAACRAGEEAPASSLHQGAMMVGGWWPFVVIAVGGFTAEAQTSWRPPPCDSQIYCTGDLLRQVQNAKLFSDDKHFVDMGLRDSPDVVLERFHNLSSQAPQGQVPKEALWQFVNTSFHHPGVEFETWTPQDWHSEPKILSKISDLKLRDWAVKLHLLWKTLGKKIKEEVKNNPDHHSQIYVPNPVVVPGGRFREFYYWDSYWVINGLLISEMSVTAKGMIENFLSLVDRFGFIPNGGRVYYLCRSQPPFLTLMMDSYMTNQNDIPFLRGSIHLLEKEYHFWMTNRSVEVEVKGKNYTLNRYNVLAGEPRPESYTDDEGLASHLTGDAQQTLYAELKSAAESGWDFSSRWFVNSGQGQTTTSLKDTRTSTIIPVELNAVMCRVERLLAGFHHTLGNKEKEQEFQANLNRRLDAVHAVLWNEHEGVWLDYDLQTRARRPEFYPTNLSPMWADCMADPNSVEKAVQYLEKSKALSYKNGIPTSLINSGEQWDLPNAWAPLQHMVIEGLEKSSSKRGKELAFELSQNWIHTNYAVFEKYKAMFEKYDVSGDGKPGGGGEYEVQEGFGWSNGVVLQLLELYGDRLSSGAVGWSSHPTWTALSLACILWTFLAQ